MNREKKFLTKDLKMVVLAKIFTTILISTIGFVVLLALLELIYHQFTFYEEDIVYMLAQVVKNYLPCLFVIIWLIDIIYVILFYWKKSWGYTEVMMYASKQLIADDDKLIHLPVELKEVEEQMNQVKMNAVKNARIAKEAEQRKNDLIVYLAHDLKTPLTSVIGYLTLLHDEQQISNELREKYLSISLNKAERLEELINEFFEITRFNLTQLTFEPSSINLTRMLEQISYEFKPMFETKNLNCNLKVDPDIQIKCDVNKMERVFDNLIRNAIHYSFENSTIKITAEKKSNGVYICFSNEGNTIPEEKLNRIFEQFYRLDSSRDTKTGGSGLGLAIAKKIIELHKGTINAYSENERIDFKIFIPTLS
ncbi:alkaline phosphatase synthesis sensor protein PhoR [Clostridium tepidiprofundi DSM 19306]|uniref:histidine kinase n=1 Tax=Clostridium tepidiprofundi DSM 19306 TaxID=1121338 RepID=A0A151AS22_9CLOT|nr:vancomycin resistance histidine kinase VanS [Clostridium tepidiprofundi]KYH30439.1 alkaline phosphatase synthesis sensor protein PhoR [Clostridium tepidiprofundi DSM 19306]